jgi:DNA-binding GntR family transcriptional regulator
MQHNGAPMATLPRSCKPRKADDAYDELKRLIVSLRLAPGEPLDERTLMATLNLGRTPLREAIQRLSAEQLVTSMPRRGSYVSELSISKLGEMIAAREVLEPQVARLAVRHMTSEDIRHLRELVQRTVIQIGNSDFEAIVYHDLEFHCAIANASCNRYLAAAVNQINTELLRYWYISFSMGGAVSSTFAHHSHFLDVLETRDEDAVEAAMLEHIDRFRERMKLIIGSGSVFPGRRAMTQLDPGLSPAAI